MTEILTDTLLTVSAERLAAALNAHGKYTKSSEDGVRWKATCECGTILTDVSNGPFFDERHRAHIADALLAAGDVVPVASLADNEALVDAVWNALDDHGHNGIECRPEKPMDYTAAAILRALAAALEDR